MALVINTRLALSKKQLFCKNGVCISFYNTFNHTVESENITQENIENVISKTNSVKTSNASSKMSDLGYIEDKTNKNENFRVNRLNIQMLSKSLYNQLFGSKRFNEPSKELIDLCLLELQKHGLPGPLQKVPDVDLQLPPILNNDIEDHFRMIGEEQCAPYRALVTKLIGPIPQIPDIWNFTPGWTKYVPGAAPAKVDYPEEDALLFDVEVCCKEGQMPTLATAVSSSAWYGWVSQDLVDGNSYVGEHIYTTDRLIPLETTSKISGRCLGDAFLKPKVVVGHSVSYDRARIKEQYWLERTGLRFIDTMSLHVCISGVTSYQKALLKSESAVNNDDLSKSSLNNLNDVHKLYCGTGIDKEQRNIFVTGTYEDIRKDFQSLMTYCAKDVQATYDILVHMWPMFLSRFPHPVTLAGMLELSTCYLPVNQNWKKYIEDSEQSYNDLDIEAKLLLSQQADKACQLLHNESYKQDLWLWDQDWNLKALKLNKPKKPTKRMKANVTNDDQRKLNSDTGLDPSSIDEYESEKQTLLEEKFSSLLTSTERLPKRQPHLAGYPEWYRKLSLPIKSADWKAGPQLISTGMKITPKLLSLTWKSMPLHHMREHGWGELVPYETDIPLSEEEQSIVPIEKLTKHYLSVNGINNNNSSEVNINISNQDLHQDVQKNCVSKMRFFVSKKKLAKNKKYVGTEGHFDTEKIGNTCGLIKLPHKDGGHLNVGNPLARDFINKFSDAGLGGNDIKTEKIIEISRKLSYWKNNHERIESQLIVWLKKNELPYALKSGQSNGAILPQVIVSGTLTRRAVESTWMTASNATDERVGSELRSMVQAPKGYYFVGADVDSQELWIASLIGDAYFGKEHGCTAFGWMTLSGQKADGTDMHSVTAKTMGISRTHAKVINYARIYGAGQPFAERLLKQFVPDISTSEARNKALKMFLTTKGRRMFQLKPEVLPDLKQRTYFRAAVQELCMLYGKSVEDLFERPKWVGGSESAMFNRLEEIAHSSEPVTPFLHCRLSRALEPTLNNVDKYVPTRINWVVQSGAVDFLHLMLVCMRWLIDNRVRFCLSFHDEVRYLVPEKLKYQTALALHVTNLLTRAFCVQRLGMVDLPQSAAFFTSVEVDTVLRKEASHDCKTPSNPHGLTKGYNIQLGESLDIWKSIEKAGGNIGIHKIRNLNKLKSSKGKLLP